MKIRSGFVSNSSSSSFCILGVEFSPKLINKLKDKIPEKDRFEVVKKNKCTKCSLQQAKGVAFCSKCGSKCEIVEEKEAIDFKDRDIAVILGLRITSDEAGDHIIGYSAEGKSVAELQKLEEKLVKILEEKVYIISGTSYDD